MRAGEGQFYTISRYLTKKLENTYFYKRDISMNL